MKKIFTILGVILLLGFTGKAQAYLSVSRNALQLSTHEYRTDTIKIFSNTSWAAGSDQAWLYLSSIDGAGDLIITITVFANPTPFARVAHITVSASGVTSQTVTVTQAGSPLLSVSNDSVVIGALSNSTSLFKITSFPDWTASCNQPWLTLQPSSFVNKITYSGTYYASGVRIHPTAGNIFFSNLSEVLTMADSVTIIKPNAGDYSVYNVQIQLTKNTIVVGGKTMIMVNVAVIDEAGGTGMLATDQSGNPTNYFDPSTRTFNLSYFYNTSAPRKVYEVVVGTPTSTTTTLTATAAKNPGSSIRQAIVTITASGIPDKIVKVTQEASPLIAVSTNSLLMAAAANSSISFTINSISNWTVESNQNWLSLSKAVGSNNDTIIVTATANPATGSRSAIISLTATGGITQIINVTQYGIVSASGKWNQFFTAHSYTDISVVNDSVIWLCRAVNTISYTLNGGISWTTKNLPPDISGNTGFCAVSATTAYIACSYGAEIGLYKTIDSANTWTLEPTGYSSDQPTNFYGTSFPDFVYFWDTNNGLTYGDDNEIYITNNGGAKWDRVTSPILLNGTGEYSIAYQASYKVVGNTIYILAGAQANGHSRILKSNNKGLTWSAIIPPTNTSTMASFDFKDDNYGLYFDYSSKPGKLFSTTDGGQTWSLINTSENLHTLKYIPNQNLYVSTNMANGLLYSTDNGQTWIANPSFNFNDAATYNSVISPNGLTTYISGSGYLYSSQNIMGENTSLDKVTITGATSLDLTFSNNVELKSANDTANYVLTYNIINTGKSTSNLIKHIKPVLALRDNSNYALVHLITETILPLDTVNISVNNVYDMNGFPLINGSTSSGQTVILNFALSATTLDIAALANSTTSFSITSNLLWEIASDQTWLSASSSSGSGNSIITLTAAENPTNAQRTATVTVSATGVTTQTILVTQDLGTTGINGIEKSKISISPNPVNTILSISGLNQNSIVTIFDLNGKMQIINQMTGNQIDISNLAKGIYTLRVTDKNGIVTKKIVKQ